MLGKITLAHVRREVRIRHQKVAKYAHGTILDVGYARKPNHYLKGDFVVGIDLETPEMHKEPSPAYDKKIQDDFKNVGKYFKEGTVDTVIALEFLEHIDWHVEFMKICNKILKKDGLLIVSTPTPYYIINLVGNAFFIKGKSQGCFEHITLHAPRVLNMVADQNGFDLKCATGATKSYMPFLTYSILYVYRKR